MTLHLNTIRNLNKNVEYLTTFSAKLASGFQIICLTESWCFADADNENIYGLPGYIRMHQVRNHGQCGADLHLSSLLLNLHIAT